MGQAQSEFSNVNHPHTNLSSTLSSVKDERPGTLLLSTTEIPSSKPVAMTGSASDRSLQLSQSMPHPSNPNSATAASVSATAVNTSKDQQTAPHFPQRRRNGTSRSSRTSKLNMKRSGSHPNSLSEYVQGMQLGPSRNANIVTTDPLMRSNLNSERPKSPEKRSLFEVFPAKAHAESRKISFTICEEDNEGLADENDCADAGTNAADALMKAERQLEEKVEKDGPLSSKISPTKNSEVPELQMKDEQQSCQMDTSTTPRSTSANNTDPVASTPSMCSLPASTDPVMPFVEYGYHYSSEGLLYFFDWDDTFLCSSYLRHLNYSLHSEFDELDEDFRVSLHQLDSAICNVLTGLFNSVTKNVFIITNSESGWVERSAMKFLPKTYAFFGEVNFFSNILSARDIYCRTIPEAASKYAQCLKNLQSNNSFFQSNNLAHINAAMSQPLQWKEFVFEKTIKEWMKENERIQEISKECNAMKTADAQINTEKKSSPIHIVCMGDTVERTAIINALSSIAALSRAPVTLFPTAHNGNVSGNLSESSDSQPVYGPSVDEAFEICRLLSEKNMILKSIKFPERPHVTQLEKQINLIASVLKYLSTHTQPLDLYLSLAVMNNSNNSANTQNNANANSANGSAQSPPCAPAKPESNSCHMKEDTPTAVQTTEVAV